MSRLRCNDILDSMVVSARRNPSDDRRQRTRQVHLGQLRLDYYPHSDRWTWFLGDEGAVTKKRAIEWLMERVNERDRIKNLEAAFFSEVINKTSDKTEVSQ